MIVGTHHESKIDTPKNVEILKELKMREKEYTNVSDLLIYCVTWNVMALKPG